MDPAEILEMAADWLESGKVNWMQYNRPQPHEYGLCALQVMYKVCASERVKVVASNPYEFVTLALNYRGAVRALASIVPPNPNPDGVIAGDRVAHWNDTLAKDVYEVVDKMKEAAKNLRNAA